MSRPGNSQEPEGSSSQRLDKWLWAARLFKTRSAAADAIAGGHVHVDGDRVKPARKIALGARLRVRRGTFECELLVRGLNAQRRPAAEAQALYEETPESLLARERETQRLKLERAQRDAAGKRPDKRGRRELGRLKRDTD